MTYAYFLDVVTDDTPNQISKDVVLIGEISNDQRREWRKNGRILGMSCALEGQTAKTGFNLWPFIQEAKAIPTRLKNKKDEKKVAKNILDSVLTYNYPGEFPTKREALPSRRKGYTIWIQILIGIEITASG